jgi:RNA polymerase-binding transcription factor DksA
MHRLRKRLEEELRLATARLRGKALEEAIEVRPSGESAFEDVDRIQLEQAREMSAMERLRLAERVKRLAAALRRIETGEYGTCVHCGGKIEEARLDALPDVDTCIGCQREIEERARMVEESREEVRAA